jgi:hypothetical protein
MSFQALNFIRAWAREHIYKPRVRGARDASAEKLGDDLRHDARLAAIPVSDIEDEIGDIDRGINDMLGGRPLNTPK